MAILVIADDLTGAAEIGGIALRYGLSVEIVHTLEAPVTKDVRILNTNTRSLKAAEARTHLGGLFDFSEKWDWIYLKFDSALRGHIAMEIPFYRGIFGKEKVVFCPASPALGRVIEGGRYWIGGKPIAETDFAHDPEFPIVESDVLEAFGARSWQLVADAAAFSTTRSPYIVAAVSDEAGLGRWAATASPLGICAGSAAFFEALLRRKFKVLPVRKDQEPLSKEPVLYVCGSNHENSIKRIAAVDVQKVVYWQDIGMEEELAQEIVHKIEKQGSVLLAVAPTVTADAQQVRESMAQVMASVQHTDTVQELIIEGGATARAVLEALHMDTLLPIWEYGQGVIRSSVPETDCTVTLKPGSYPWTEKLWVFGK